jgi:outer membrane protein
MKYRKEKIKNMSKNTIKTIAFALFTIGTLAFASAQKIAHISLDSLIGLMPESKTAKDIADNYLNDLKKTASAMDQELQTKYADYQANEATMSDLIKKTKQDELQALNQRIQDFQQSAEQEYRKKYGELTQPIYDKAKKAIEAAAKEGGYKYVLDTSVGNVLYHEAAEDLLTAAKKKLDGMPAVTFPGAGNATKPNSTPNKGGTTPKGK